VTFYEEVTLAAGVHISWEIDSLVGTTAAVGRVDIYVTRVRDDTGAVVSGDTLNARATGPVATGAQVTFDTWTADTSDAERTAGDQSITTLPAGTFRVRRSIVAPA
jgi:hypothetical protein